MTSAFDADFEAADALLAEAFGVRVSIIRRGFVTPNVLAEVVSRDEEIDEPEGTPQVAADARDYIIARTAYRIDGEEVEPQPGDVIRETIRGESYDFTLLPTGNRPVKEWADANGNRWLIHAKR